MMANTTKKTTSRADIAKTLTSIIKTMECSICIRISLDPVSVGCGHFFCRECIITVLNRNYRASCPLCMKSYTKRSIHEAIQRKSMGKALFDVMETMKNASAFEVMMSRPDFSLEKTFSENMSCASVQLPDTEASVRKSPANVIRKKQRKSNDSLVFADSTAQECIEETSSLALNKEVPEDISLSLKSDLFPVLPDDSNKKATTSISDELSRNVCSKKQSRTAKLFQYFEKTTNALLSSSDRDTKKDEISASGPARKYSSSSETDVDGVVCIRSTSEATTKDVSLSFSSIEHEGTKSSFKKGSPNLEAGISTNKHRVTKYVPNSKTLKNISGRTHPKKKIRVSKSKLQKMLQIEKSNDKVDSRNDDDNDPDDDDANISFDVDFSSSSGNKRSLNGSDQPTASYSDGNLNENASDERLNGSDKPSHSKKFKSDNFKPASTSFDNTNTPDVLIGIPGACSDDADDLIATQPFSTTNKNDNPQESGKEMFKKYCVVEKEVAEIPSPVCKSPGWSRIKQMNKDFHLKTVPLLQVLKKRSPPTSSKFKSTNTTGINAKFVSPPVALSQSPEHDNLLSDKVGNYITTPEPMQIIEMQKQLPLSGESFSRKDSASINTISNNPNDAHMKELPPKINVQIPICASKSVTGKIFEIENNSCKSSEKTRLMEIDENNADHNNIIFPDSNRLPSPEVDSELFNVNSQSSFSHRKVRRHPKREKSISSDLPVNKLASNCKRKRLFCTKYVKSVQQNSFESTEGNYGLYSKSVSKLSSTSPLSESLKKICISKENEQLIAPEGGNFSKSNSHEDRVSHLDNTFTSSTRSLKDKKIIKKVCLTLDEVEQHFKNYNKTGRTQIVCSVPLPFSDLNLELNVSEQTLNVSLFKLKENSPVCDAALPMLDSNRDTYSRRKMPSARKRFSSYRQRDEAQIISQPNSGKTNHVISVGNINYLEHGHSQKSYSPKDGIQQVESEVIVHNAICDNIVDMADSECEKQTRNEEAQCLDLANSNSSHSCRKSNDEKKSESQILNVTNVEQSNSLLSTLSEKSNETSQVVTCLNSQKDCPQNNIVCINKPLSQPNEEICNETPNISNKGNILEENCNAATCTNKITTTSHDDGKEFDSKINATPTTSLEKNRQNTFVSPGKEFFDDDFVFNEEMDFSMQSLCHGKYEDYIKNSDNYSSSDPDVDFAKKLVVPLKNAIDSMAKKQPNDQNKHSNQNQIVASDQNQSISSLIKSKAKENASASKLLRKKMKKFKRIKTASSSEDSDCYDIPTQPFVAKKTCSLMTRNQNIPSNEVTKKNSSDANPEDESLLCTEDICTGAVDKIRLEIEEMDAKIKLLQEKISLGEFSDNDMKGAPTADSKQPTSKDGWDEFMSDDSRDSTEIFTEPIPPTPPIYPKENN